MDKFHHGLRVHALKRALNGGKITNSTIVRAGLLTKFPMTLINTNNEVLASSCRIIITNESFSFDSFS
ncbi:hypothetical protein [Massilia scottii]|uniref:hypothetical protein n=1 Tax=Massilia scottii TaxID=3057166 RepID=UPI00279686DE|nr:hypothetical protein [Massilia sp. CCM 9029]MDQ1833701.1 hypothetical protein [Massilia sp. CCM 9029]